jgi:hypothetical protein
VAALEDSGAVEGANPLARGARAPVGEAVEVPTAVATGGEGGGMAGALIM